MRIHKCLNQLIMQTTTITLPYNARTVYTAIENLMRQQHQFSSVKYDEQLRNIEARRGMWISPFSESIKIKVMAIGTEMTEVCVESSSRSILNLLNWGSNKNNIGNLKQYICNEVYKLQNVQQNGSDHSTIRISTPDIRMKW